MQDIQNSNIKCPKCRSSDHLILTELWINHTITWELINGKADLNSGTMEPGDAYKLEGRCKKCGHKWRIRNKKQIGELFNR